MTRRDSTLFSRPSSHPSDPETHRTTVVEDAIRWLDFTMLLRLDAID